MVKPIQIFGRFGNKTNDIKYFKHLLPLDVNTVVEPFGGTFAVSRCVYRDINKYNYHINDLDENLFYIYTHLDDYIKLITDVKNLEFSDTDTTKDKLKKIKELKHDEILINFLLFDRIVRGGIIKIPKVLNFDPLTKTIINKGIVTNLDYKIILDQYKDDDKAFLFIDPPYLFSDNSGYFPQNDDGDMTDIIIYLLEYLKTAKCKVMIIINDLKLLRHIYKDFIKGDYMRIYQMSKKKMKHLILTNY